MDFKFHFHWQIKGLFYPLLLFPVILSLSHRLDSPQALQTLQEKQTKKNRKNIIPLQQFRPDRKQWNHWWVIGVGVGVRGKICLLTGELLDVRKRKTRRKNIRRIRGLMMLSSERRLGILDVLIFPTCHFFLSWFCFPYVWRGLQHDPQQLQESNSSWLSPESSRTSKIKWTRSDILSPL